MEINNPHDRFFKETLSKENNARDFLRQFLPGEIVSLIDVDSISLETTSFIDEDLQEFHSDLIYKVLLKGKEAFVYILLEHKSTPEPNVPFYLLRNMLKLWQCSIDNKEKRLPLIIPYVFYHGKRDWKYSTNFEDLVDIPENGLERFVPRFDLLFQDISEQNDDELKILSDLGVMLMAMKYIFSEHFDEKFAIILRTFSNVLHSDVKSETLQTILLYIMTVTEMPVKRIREMIEDNLTKNLGGIAMTTAEKLMQQGMQKGKLEAAREMVLEVLEERFEGVTSAMKDRIVAIAYRGYIENTS